MGGGSVGTRVPGFCLNRVKPQAARVRSPPQLLQAEKSKTNEEENTAAAAAVDSGGGDGDQKAESGAGKSVGGRRIVIVVDGSAEAKGAIQWALTHTAQPQDILVLLHVIKPAADNKTVGEGFEECSKETAPKAYKLVETLTNFCHLKRPEVKTEVAVIRGKEKGAAIVKEAAKQGAGLLVLGQKKRSMTMTWRLLMMWTGRGSGCGGGVVEYCIQNANCMAVAVRRKSKKLGGYLITTKRHKDFWLLA